MSNLVVFLSLLCTAVIRVFLVVELTLKPERHGADCLSMLTLMLLFDCKISGTND